MPMSSSALLLPALLLLASDAPSPEPALQARPAAERPSEKAAPALRDAPLEPWRAELLELAYRTAGAVPVYPHIKDRSRMQEAAVAACLELDQPARALRYAEGIENWRRGVAHADLAFHLARGGEVAAADRHLDLAAAVADAPPDEDFQEWRRDRIRAKIARTHLWLGRAVEAAAFEQDLVAAEQRGVSATKADLANTKEFDGYVAALDAAAATADFDHMRGILDAYLRLHERFYQDEARRTALQAKVEAAYPKLPIQVRMEAQTGLAEAALAHGDAATARARADEVQRLFDSVPWTLDARVPLIAGLATLRHRAGQQEQAGKLADAAFAAFQAERETIADVFRAETLLPLAEAYVALGDEGSARTVYALALREGLRNPNSWPRADDLSATCRSLALHEVEPDEALWKALREAYAGLGEPW